MAEYKEEYITDFLEYCEIMKLKPTVRDQIIFMAGMTFQSLKQQHLTTDSTCLAQVKQMAQKTLQN